MHIFISYVREDRAQVDRLCEELRSVGINIWLDRERIHPGQRWQQSIRSAIQSGSYFIACFSNQYSGRERSYMNEELIIAIEELRKMPLNRTWFIPVVLDDSSVPDRAIGGGETLRDIQWVKLCDDWENGIKKIIKTINPSSIVQNEPLVIMITDICDSRNLPEGATIQIKEIQYKEIEKNGGRTNINRDDVCIAAFESITSAIRCASNIHENLAKYLGNNSDRRLGVRIGMHFGKVSLSEGNVIETSGSEISIAYKLCREAEPGQTLISGSVKRNMDLSAFKVRQHLTVSKGLFEETIEVYAVVINAEMPQPGASR